MLCTSWTVEAFTDKRFVSTERAQSVHTTTETEAILAPHTRDSHRRMVITTINVIDRTQDPQEEGAMEITGAQDQKDGRDPI